MCLHLQTWVKHLYDENTTLVSTKNREPRVERPQETFRFAGRPGSLPAGASRARSTLCALARAPRSSRSVQRTVVSVREQSPAGPRGVRVGGVTRRCCFLGGRAKPPPRGSATPRRADASMTKVPRRDVSETDRGGSIRAAAPGAGILKIATRSSHSSVSRSDARWLAREKTRESPPATAR